MLSFDTTATYDRIITSEDIDFTSQLKRFGRVVGPSTLIGVHLGAKSGRENGIRLGYSLVANPVSW
jgi:hypothetical protein